MRVRHDDPSISTIDASIVERGATDRRAITVPEDAGLEDGSVIRVVLEEETYYAVPLDRGEESLLIAGAYAMPGQARDPGGATNHLERWFDDKELVPGRTVHVDIVSPEYVIGLRAPGESASYNAGEPNESLSDIAEDL